MNPRVLRIGPRTVAALALASVVGARRVLLAASSSRRRAAFAHSTDAPVHLRRAAARACSRSCSPSSPTAASTPRRSRCSACSSAIGAALRPLGAGTAGIETVFFLLVLGGRVLGPGFGFVLGCTTLFASALLTGGVGPWLPFQMFGRAWVGLGAGLLPAGTRPRARSRCSPRTARCRRSSTGSC